MSKRVYIAGPISKGDLLKNIQQAEDVFVKLMNAGLAPWVPHWSCYMGSSVKYGSNPQVVAFANPNAGNFQPKQWVDMDLAWVQVADAILRLPGESVGADREVAHALAHNIPVFNTAEDVVKWAQQEQGKHAQAI